MNNLNELLEIMKDHAEQDRLIRGEWLSKEQVNGKFKGCFYGCAMQSSNNTIETACERYGMPLWIGYWSEKVFEKLPEEVAFKFPVEFLEKLISFNGDTERLRHDLAIKRLNRLLPTSSDEVNTAIKQVIEYHKYPDEEKRLFAYSVALSAEKSSQSATWSATLSAAWSAHSAAWSAAQSAAQSATWSAQSAEKLAQSAQSAEKLATWSSAWSAQSATWSARSAAWEQEVADMYELLDEVSYE